MEWGSDWGFYDTNLDTFCSNFGDPVGSKNLEKNNPDSSNFGPLQVADKSLHEALEMDVQQFFSGDAQGQNTSSQLDLAGGDGGNFLVPYEILTLQQGSSQETVNRVPTTSSIGMIPQSTTAPSTTTTMTISFQDVSNVSSGQENAGTGTNDLQLSNHNSTESNQKSRRRKPVQTSRNVDDNDFVLSPEDNSVELIEERGSHQLATHNQKSALSTLNSNGMVTRANSRASMAMAQNPNSVIKLEPPSPTTSLIAKRKRKYEEDDERDPSVKNAKAARKNREKKKQETEDLKVNLAKSQKEVKDLQEEKFKSDQKMGVLGQETENLRYERENLRLEVQNLRNQLNQERMRNAAADAHRITIAQWVQHLVNTAPIMYNRTPDIVLSSNLAGIRVPSPSEGQHIRNVVQQNGYFMQNIPGVSYQQSLTCEIGLNSPNLVLGLKQDANSIPPM